MKYYIDHDFFNLKSTKNLHLISKFKTKQQETDYACGPACALMVLKYTNSLLEFSEADISKFFKTSPKKGTSFNTYVKGFKKLGFKIFSTYDMKKDKNGLVFPTFEGFKKFVIENLKKNNPIIVLSSIYGGHYTVIIGYDEVSNKDTEDDMLIFADPYDNNDGCYDGYSIYSADRFFYEWFDSSKKRKLTKQGFVIVTKD